MGLKNLAIVVMLLLVGSGALPAATQAQDATPAAGGPGPTEIEIPDARILALSPDGQSLAVRKPTGGRAEQLCVYEVATQAERACANLEERRIRASDDSVVWSPDSTKIAFTEDAFRDFIDGDLWVMDAATGELTNATDDGFEGGLPILDEDEEQPETPIHVDVLPAWAPDSGSITFSRSPIIGGEFRGNQITSVDLESGDIETLVPVTLVPVTLDVPGVVYWGLAWAPDGQRLYYSVAYPDLDNPQNGVWAYDRATGQARHILVSDSEKGPPAMLRVAANGQTGLIIYPLFMMEFSSEGDAYALLDLETNTLLPVNPVASDPSSPVLVHVATFSPDGTRILYGLHQFADDTGRFLVRDLPDGQPEAAAAGLDARPFMTTIGGGLFWANDGTVYVATDLSTGLLLHLDPGAVPEMPSAAPVGTPEAAPATSPAAGGEIEPGTTVTLTAETSMRATPSDNGTVVLELRPGAELIVVGAPVEAGGVTWVPVIEPATGTIGYVKGDLL